MNERIKELKAQALKECLDKSDGLVQGETITLREFHDFVEERFAELIVREVIAVYNHDGFQTPYEQDRLVLKHFGIEE